MLGGRRGRTASPARGLGDGAVAAAALATAAGAWSAVPTPWPGAAIAAGAVGARRRALGPEPPLVAGCFFLSCTLAAHAWAARRPCGPVRSPAS